MDDTTFQLAYGHIKELYYLCSSDNLSLSALQEKIDVLDERDIQNISRVQYIELPKAYEEGNEIEQFPFLHMACRNKNVTLEIVKYIIDTFPNPNGEWSSDKFCPCETEVYPLHLACCNEDCPSDVIKFLVEHYPSALEQLCTIDEGIHPNHPECYIQGLPLHYYLLRDKNVDFDTVRMLVEAYPQSLMTFDEEWPCYPIHLALSRRRIHLEIIEYFLELEPASLGVRDGDGNTLLHLAFENKRMNLSLVQLLVNSTEETIHLSDGDATFLHLVCYHKHLTLEIYQFIFNKWPEAIRIRDDSGSLPIHALSRTNTLDEDVSIEILRLMLDIDPTFARERDSEDYRPIDWAVSGSCPRPFQFCKMLIDAYPESLSDSWPIHLACYSGMRDDSADTIQYMLDLCPESSSTWDWRGYLPIHGAAWSGNTKAIELLLKHDSSAATKKSTELPAHSPKLPLHLACDPNCRTFCADHLTAVQTLYDTYPEAILIQSGNDSFVRRTPLDTARNRGRKLLPIVRFLESQLDYAQKAQDMTVMTTLDENGWLPLHHALKEKASLGSIKLLLKSNPSSLWTTDFSIAFPLHIAFEFSSEKVVRFLVGRDVSGHILNHCDANKDSVLHYACRGGNLDVVKYLLDEHIPLVSTAEVNENGKLPIHLLCEAGKDKVDCESTEYIEVIWRMLLANPEAVAGE